MSVDFHGNAPAINKTIQIENGKTAFDVLNANAKVEYKTYAGMGVFITTINNVSVNDKWYWLIFADEKAINVAADKYILKDREAISYVYISANGSKKYFIN